MRQNQGCNIIVKAYFLGFFMKQSKKNANLQEFSVVSRSIVQQFFMQLLLDLNAKRNTMICRVLTNAPSLSAEGLCERAFLSPLEQVVLCLK